MKRESIFQGVKESPFHLSVGAILTNEKGEIACHFFTKEDLPIESEGKRDVYLLMHETLHADEPLEDAVFRGLKEEFGAEGTIKSFIGSAKTHYPLRTSDAMVEKTTLYFHVEKTHFDPSLRDLEQVESKSDVLWFLPHKLYNIFLEQGKHYERTDMDESDVIQKYIHYVSTK